MKLPAAILYHIRGIVFLRYMIYLLRERGRVVMYSVLEGDRWGHVGYEPVCQGPSTRQEPMSTWNSPTKVQVDMDSCRVLGPRHHVVHKAIARVATAAHRLKPSLKSPFPPPTNHKMREYINYLIKYWFSNFLIATCIIFVRNWTFAFIKFIIFFSRDQL